MNIPTVDFLIEPLSSQFDWGIGHHLISFLMIFVLGGKLEEMVIASNRHRQLLLSLDQLLQETYYQPRNTPIFDLWNNNSDRAPPKRHNTFLEASYRHLLEIPFHAALQKVEVWLRG
jgi:hypothetical protein